MKKIFLPLFAVLALASCGNDMDGKDGSDANDSMENSIQAAGTEMKNDVNDATDNAGARMDNATDSMDLHNDKNDMDGKDTMRNPN